MNQYKLSDELEIYEMDYIQNHNLQEVCEMKQPIIFQFEHIHPELFETMNPQNISKYYSYDILIKDCHDYYKSEEERNIDGISLPFGTSVKLMENDPSKHFFSEKNQDFLEESGLTKTLSSCNDSLKPNFIISSHYDLLFGSPGTVTPLRFHNDYRKYICVTNGSIHIKMTPWKSAKYLHAYKDYDNYEFFSTMHPTHPKPEHAIDFEKTKFLEFDVSKGGIVYIPPYWFYSIVYSEEPNTFVCEFTYNSIMNCVANIPDLALYWLQQQNITKKITKKSTLVVPEKDVLESDEQTLEKEEIQSNNEKHIEESKDEESILPLDEDTSHMDKINTPIIDDKEKAVKKKQKSKKNEITVDNI